MRGILTENVKKIAKDFLGREINIAELRLYPYIDYVMKNSQKIEISKVNAEERGILSVLKKEGHIDGVLIQLLITREFYDYLQNILWEAYVATQ